MTPRPGSNGFNVLEHELLQEKAATLARMGRRFTTALEALRAVDRSAEMTEVDEERRMELVAAAGEALWFYVIQREVCGLRDSEAMMRQLEVPREVRLRMGLRGNRRDAVTASPAAPSGAGPGE